ncbi:hypothetical protein M501DRAFT_1004790 [Patellaria atrata CBS 101060]|uniref:Uncharacterized protein n=1 Tax=Patellaria atrata CBS 101060 TaxID=1346257 RepID=A0A9P4SBV6_9PEZI|nr:hypothetical protein M501DRAFT_1004790 [Patellaria atrata CBS 101060]
MAFLSRLSDNFWSFVSPRKTKQQRDKPFKAATPASKISKKLPTPVPNLTSQMRRYRSLGSPAVEVEGSSSKRSRLSTPASSAQFESSATSESDDFEGDTLIDSPDYKSYGFDQEEYNANDDTIVVDETQIDPDELTWDPDEERRAREKKADALLEHGWSADAIKVFKRIQNRGFEPLMPWDWEKDFEAIPLALFTKDWNRAYIKPTFGTEFRACKALQNLVYLGPRVRDTIINHSSTRQPEDVLGKAIEDYIKWSHEDAKLNASNCIPLLSVVTGSKDTSTKDLQNTLIDALEVTADRYREAFVIHSSVEDVSTINEISSEIDAPEFTQPIPTLYGAIMTHTMMGLLAYDSPGHGEAPQLRTVGIFDWGKEDYDFWNALALAIFVVHCRDRAIELKEVLDNLEGELGSDDSDDPDA